MWLRIRSNNWCDIELPYPLTGKVFMGSTEDGIMDMDEYEKRYPEHFNSFCDGMEDMNKKPRSGELKLSTQEKE